MCAVGSRNTYWEALRTELITSHILVVVQAVNSLTKCPQGFIFRPFFYEKLGRECNCV